MLGRNGGPRKGARHRDEWPGLQDSGRGQGFRTGVHGRNEVSGQWCWGEGNEAGVRAKLCRPEVLSRAAGKKCGAEKVGKRG